MLGQSGYADWSEEGLLEALIGRRVDGVVLIGVVHAQLGRRRLMAPTIPVVEAWDLTSIDMLVGFSHAAIGLEVAGYLYKLAAAQEFARQSKLCRTLIAAACRLRMLLRQRASDRR